MQLQFNAYDYDPAQGGSICFPLADYKLEITAAEPKVVKDNPGAGYLELTYTVLEGDMRGLTHKHRLNLFNPSEVAKRIAHQELSAIAIAIERPYLQATEQLIGGRLIATIGPQANDEKYSEIKAIKMKDGTAPTRQGAPAQQQTAAAPPPPAQFPGPATAQSAPLWGASGAPAPATPSAAPATPSAAPPWASGPPAPPAHGGASAPPWASGPPSQVQGATAAPPWAK